MAVDPTLVHRAPNGRCICWQRCENTYVLMMEEENHTRWEWRVAGEAVERQIYNDQPKEWTAYVITDDGKVSLGARPTKEEAWRIVEEYYSSATKQTPSLGSNSTS